MLKYSRRTPVSVDLNDRDRSLQRSPNPKPYDFKIISFSLLVISFCLLFLVFLSLSFSYVFHLLFLSLHPFLCTLFFSKKGLSVGVDREPSFLLGTGGVFFSRIFLLLLLGGGKISSRHDLI